MNQKLSLPKVLTLEETARFLRVPKKTIERLASEGKILARQIDGSWQFLGTAVEEWLRGKGDGKTAMLKLAGALADDPTLMPMLREIYRQRGRPETEAEAVKECPKSAREEPGD